VKLISPYPAVVEFIHLRINEKTSELEKREKMLTYIENNPGKKEKSTGRKPLLCIDLEKESKCIIYHSKTTSTPNPNSKPSPIKAENQILRSFQRPSIQKSKTYRTLEKFKLPEVFKLQARKQSLGVLNSDRVLPHSLNENMFRATNGLSIKSFNTTQTSSFN
jgi:hypothetical protein